MNRKYPWHKVAPITDLKDMLLQSAATFGKRDAFLVKKGERREAISFDRLKDLVFQLSAALQGLGSGPGQKVAICSEGRWEWGVSYLATACLNGINIPLDKDLRPADIRHILDETQTPIALTSAKYLDVLLEVQGRLPCLRTIVCFDLEQPTEKALSFARLLDSEGDLLSEGRTDVAELKIDPSQPVSIVYTSGTMGSAKGVVLSQKNLVSNMMDMCASVYIDEKDTFLSVLPLNHTYECTCGLLTPIYRGSRISYCDNVRRIGDEMKEVQATVLLGVPLLFQAISRRIQDGIRQKGTRKFKFAVAVASVADLIGGVKGRRAVFHSLHERFGGRLRMLISGGAASDPEVAQLFHRLGIIFIQGYGLTECSPIIAVNRPHYFKDAAAGFPLPSVEVKIAEDGEICARGPNVMSGYYKNPEATADVLQDGWFHTGDLGYLDSDGFVFIRGRKKAVIVLKNGKNVHAEEVEFHLNHSPFILESLVWEGPDAPEGEVEEVHATIVPNREQFDQYAKDNGVSVTDQLVEEHLRKEVRKQCAHLPHYKRVRKFTIRWEEFDKTTTRKIKRYLYTAKMKQVPT